MAEIALEKGQPTWQVKLGKLLLLMMFASRAFTFLFSSTMGSKGVLLLMALMAGLIFALLLDEIKSKREGKVYVFFHFFFILAIATSLSVLLNPGLSKWLFKPDWGFAIKVLDLRGSIFVFLAVLLLADYENILDGLEKAAKIGLVYFLFQIFLYYFVGDWRFYYSLSVPARTVYNMSLGYELVFVGVTLLAVGFYKNDLKNIGLGALASNLAFFFGSRGVLVVLASFFAITFLFISGERKKNLKNLFIFILAFILASIVTSFGPKLINNLSHLMSEKDLLGDMVIEDVDDESSRNRDLLSEGEFLEDNARERLWTIATSGIKEKPLLGRGVFGDRLIVGKYYVWGYSHNIFIEMMNNFGLVGIIFLLYLVYLSIKILLGPADLAVKYLIVIFASMSTKLLVSDSFWFLKEFWGLIGIIVLFYIKRKDRLTRHLPAYLGLMAVFVISLFAMVKVDMKRQDFKAIALDRPSVVLTFEGSLEKSDQVYDLFEKKDVVATSFISAGLLGEEDYLTKDHIKARAEAGWDIQDNGYVYTNLNSFRYNMLEADFKESEAFFEENQLGPIKAFLPPYSAMTPGLVTVTDSNRDFTYRPVWGGQNLSFKEITLADTQRLRGLTLFRNARSFGPMSDALNQAGQDQGLVFLHFGDYGDQTARIKQLSKLIDLLKDRDFEFLTFSDLSARSQAGREDQTFKNYLSNLGVLEVLR